MKSSWHVVANVACGLWLGGLIALFIFVVTLFHNDHAIAVQAAPQLFQAFEIYQFFLAAAAIISAVLARRLGVALLFFLATIGAFTTHFDLTPQILDMARLGQTHTDHFGQVHGETMMVYTAQTILIFINAILLPLKRK